jgi:hypothetical protein
VGIVKGILVGSRFMNNAQKIKILAIGLPIGWGAVKRFTLVGFRTVNKFWTSMEKLIKEPTLRVVHC